MVHCSGTGVNVLECGDVRSLGVCISLSELCDFSRAGMVWIFYNYG